MSKYNLLILSPHLDLSGGVVSFVHSLKGLWGVNEVYFYRGGKGKSLLGYFRRVLELLVFLAGVVYYKDAKVFMNTSLNRKAYIRDRVFCRFAVLFGKEVYLFIHGWDSTFFDSVQKGFSETVFFKAKRIFVLSQEFKDNLTSIGFREKDVVVEHTVVKDTFTSRFRNFEKNFDEGKFNILFLARLEEAKGVFVVLESFKKLVKEHSNLVLHIAGTGTGTNSVMDWIELNDSLPIHFHGNVKGTKKVNLFKQAHFYVLPTKREGLPISVLEAISAGCVVLVTPVGGLKDFFKDCEMGFVLNNLTQDELSNKMDLALKDVGLLKKIASENLKRGQFQYTPISLINRIKSTIYG